MLIIQICTKMMSFFCRISEKVTFNLCNHKALQHLYANHTSCTIVVVAVCMKWKPHIHFFFIKLTHNFHMFGYENPFITVEKEKVQYANLPHTVMCDDKRNTHKAHGGAYTQWNYYGGKKYSVRRFITLTRWEFMRWKIFRMCCC